MSKLQSEQRKQAVTGKIRSQVTGKVELLSEKFKGLAGQIQGFLDDLKQFEINCVRNLVRRNFTYDTFYRTATLINRKGTFKSVWKSL